jgi:TPR repeat protein
MSLISTIQVFCQDENGLLLMKESESGNAEAQYELSICYSNGWSGFVKDKAEELNWLKLSAENGNAKAQCRYGELFVYGNGYEYGIEDNAEEFLKWMLQSANSGYDIAMLALGRYYKDINDKNNAIYWYKKENELFHQQYGEDDTRAVKRLRELGTLNTSNKIY